MSKESPAELIAQAEVLMKQFRHDLSELVGRARSELLHIEMSLKGHCAVVHLLEAGAPLCRFSDKLLGNWPPGHLWIPSTARLDMRPKGWDPDIIATPCDDCQGIRVARASKASHG